MLYSRPGVWVLVLRGFYAECVYYTRGSWKDFVPGVKKFSRQNGLERYHFLSRGEITPAQFISRLYENESDFFEANAFVSPSDKASGLRSMTRVMLRDSQSRIVAEIVFPWDGAYLNVLYRFDSGNEWDWDRVAMQIKSIFGEVSGGIP